MMDLEAVQVSNYLRSHPDFVEEWLSRNADSALLEAVRIKWSKQPKPHSPPITIQRPQSQPQNENEILTYRKKFKCINRKDLSIWGDYNSAKAQQIAIKFKMCEGRPDCESVEATREWLRGKFIILLYN